MYLPDAADAALQLENATVFVDAVSDYLSAYLQGEENEKEER